MSLELAHKLIAQYQMNCGAVPKRIPLPVSAFVKLMLDCKSCITETSDDYVKYKLYGTPMPSQFNADFITVNTIGGSAEFYPESDVTKGLVL